MILKTMLMMLLTISVYSQCTDGCLKCVQKTCQYCDLQSGYRLVGQKCEKFQIENCDFANNLGTCLKCTKDYHLDLSTKKCIKILTQNLIENCLTYNSPNSCLFCKAGFFLENGKCIQVSQPIENCLYENSQQICLKCQQEYILSIDQKQCIQNPKETNCATYKNVQCNSCKPGYIYNPNQYLQNLLTLATSKQQQDFLFYNDDLNNKMIDTKKFSTCVQTKVQNCIKFQRFDFCEVCNQGYFLTQEGQCQENPKDAILYCQQYDSLTSCSQCQQGYWLNDKKECQQVKEVKFCKEYSGQPLKSNCIRCLDTHFLIGLNNCVPRDQLEILNCQKLNSNSETCYECLNTFKLTDDNSQCLQSINDCQVYQSSNYLTKKLQCKICNEGFYYNKDEQICMRGDREFCKIYQHDQPNCLICDNKYYLQDGVCIPHDVIPQCEVYHPRIKNVCYRCNYETFLFHKLNSCELTEDIPNCKIYKDRQTCVQYNTCQLIPASENCVRRSGNQCGKCLKDFVLQDGICRDPLDYIVNECELDNINGITNYNQQQCKYCKEQRVPFNYKNTYVCVENDYMLLQQNKQTLDQNCLQYITDNNYKFSCIKCKFPNVVLDGQCVTQCPPTHTLYKQVLKQLNINADRINESFQIQSVNQCGKLIPYCRIAAPDLNQKNPDHITYTCIECDTNSIPLIEFNNNQNRVLIEDPHDQKIQYGKSPVSYNPSTTCIPSQQTTVIGEVNNFNMIDNCQYYQNLGIVKGCIKCLHGYNGVVLDLVNQCEVYSNNQYTCKQSSPYECKPVQEVLNCLKYSKTSNTTKCIQCQNGYYVASDTFCSLRNLSRDISNCQPVDNADACVCEQNFFNSNQNGGYTCEQKPSYCLQANKINGQIVCQLCDDTKSFIQGNVCVAGSIDQCIKYKEDQSYCLQCNNQYFVKDGVCVQHTTLTQCDIYSQFNKNTCISCNKYSILFEYQTRCVQFDEIDNCQEYDSTTTCKKCNDTYRLENLRKRCLSIADDQNCIVQNPVDIYNSDNIEKIDILDAMNQTLFLYDCQKCKQNYLKLKKQETFVTNSQIEKDGVQVPHPKSGQNFDVNKCINYQSSLLINCNTSIVDGNREFQQDTNNGQCLKCNTDSQLEDLADDRHVCLDKSYFSIVQNDLDVDNCEMLHYETINGQKRYKCQRCKHNYYQSETNTNGTNTCSNTCTTNNTVKLIGYILKDAGTNKWTIDNKDRTCKDTANNFPVHNLDPDASATTDVISNCETYSRFLGQSNKITCVKCKDGYLPVMRYADNITTLITEGGNVQENPFGVQLGFTQCIKKGDSNYNQVGTFSNNEVTGCKYYGIDKTGDVKSVYCFRCDIGKSGPLKTNEPDPTNNSGTKFGYIESCSNISNCSTDDINNVEKYGVGLQHKTASENNGNLMKYFTCFKCTDSNEIPMLHIKLDANGKIEKYVEYDATKADGDNYEKENATTPGHAVACRNVYKTNGTVTITAQADQTGYKTVFSAATAVVPLNCAIGIINTGSVGDIATIVSSSWGKQVGCLACKPGYAPVQATAPTANNPTPVDSCKQIANCTTAGSYMNGCEQCIHYYDYTVTDGNAIDYSKCVPERQNDDVLLTNCFAAYSVGKCQVCKPGYTKDKNGKCEQIKANFCDETFYAQDQAQLTLFNGKANTPVSLMMYLLRYNAFKGCNKCTQVNDKLVLLNKVQNDRDKNLPNQVCTKNPLNTQRIIEDNCINYGWDNINSKSICVQCHTDYVLTKQNQCSLKTFNDMTNCELLNEMNGTTCLKCKVGYLIVGGLCIDKSNAVQNCEQYDEPASEFGSVAICNKCTSGNYLETPSKCTQNPIEQCAIYDKDNKDCIKCQNEYQKIIKKNGEQFCYKVVPSTNDDNQNQCIEWDNDQFQMKKLKCLKCKFKENTSSYLATNTDLKIKTECIKFSTQTDQQLDSLNCIKFDIKPLEDQTQPNQFMSNTFRCLECTQDNGVDKYLTYYYDRATAECKIRTQVTNCKKHSKEKDVCDECIDNFVLKNNVCEPLVIQDVNILPKNYGYIQSCSLMNTCDNKIKYEGLNVHIQTLASCHKCINENEIPFIATRTSDNMNTIQSIQEYGFVTDLTQNFISQSGEKSTQCLNPIKGTFNIQNDTDFVFPTNCGMGMINVKEVSKNNTLNSANEKHGIYCVACQPKYKPTYTQLFNYYVESCQVIDNCEISTWFNNCSQCKPGYSYGYDMGVKYNQCVEYQDNSNCYSVEIINTEKRCKICRQGYVLNVDGYCEAIIAPRCGYGKFDFRRHYQIHDLPVQLVLQGDGPGCQQCDDGFVGLYKEQNTVACTASPYHTDNKVLENSKYLFKCKNYKVTKEGRLECQICQDEYVLSIRGKCYTNQNLQNCKLSLNDTKCRDCLDGFVNIDRNCVKGDIDQCKIYGNKDQSFEQICIKCNDGYFLRDNICVKGQVNNCQQFLNEKQCLKCQPKYGLMKIHKGENYCFPINDNMNCKQVSDQHLQFGQFQCLECNNNTQVLLHDPLDIQTTTCMPFIKTENCIRYNKTDSLIQTTFDCIECSQDFYLNNGQCIERTIKHSNCVQYQIELDECQKCTENYFLSDDAKSCQPYPEGTPNCQVYLTQTECLICKNGFYLKNKICQKIPEDQSIDNCILYEDLEVCSQCEDSYLLLDGICVKSNATGCLTYKTINSCATCPNGNGFVQEGNLLNCQPQQVANCLEIDPYEPYPCLRCENGFFLQDNKCNTVSQPIENCLRYSDSNTCEQCDVGFALTSDKTTCLQNAMLVSLLDPYCLDSKINEQPVCNTCQFGHVFKHGYCLQCSTNTLEDGCLNCNPSNQEQCLICRQGYYQHSNGKCYKNGELPPEEKPQDNDNTDTPTDNTNENEDKENDTSVLAMKQILTYLIWVFII